MFDFDNAMAFINGFDKLGKPIKDLNRISALLKFFHNPQDKLKFIHITGTNGKGSAAEMCSQILIKAGYRVGLFTSPFIVEYTDRIRINGQNIPKNELCEIASYVKETISNIEYQSDFSQFEITTTIAFIYFARIQCDIVVLETGIGGLLDATNVILSPIVSIITSISYDHTSILGETLEEIAAQKAGIIKKNCSCIISANNPKEVVSVIKNVANKMKSELLMPCYDMVYNISTSVNGSKFIYKCNNYILRMAGEHQIINALSVIEAMNFVQRAGFFITNSHIKDGIESSRVFARAEILSNQPLVILDGAHNQSGMKALADIVKTANCPSCVAVIGMLKDKNALASLKEIAPFVSEFICVEGFHPNEVCAGELVKILNSLGKNAFAIYDINLALIEAKNLISEDGLLLICGSLYLSSLARKIYLK